MGSGTAIITPAFRCYPVWPENLVAKSRSRSTALAIWPAVTFMPGNEPRCSNCSANVRHSRHACSRQARHRYALRTRRGHRVGHIQAATGGDDTRRVRHTTQHRRHQVTDIGASPLYLLLDVDVRIGLAHLWSHLRPCRPDRRLQTAGRSTPRLVARPEAHEKVNVNGASGGPGSGKRGVCRPAA
jgi:hypothetical protein